MPTGRKAPPSSPGYGQARRLGVPQKTRRPPQAQQTEVIVQFSASAKKLLLDKYPHCAELLRVFAPLYEFQCAAADELPPPVLPPLERNSFLQGKAYLQPDRDTLDIYLDDALLTAASGAAKAAAKAMPDLKAEFTELGNFLGKNPRDCRDLIALSLLGKRHRVSYWAKKRGMNKNAAALLSIQLAQTAARRTAKAAAPVVLPDWDKGHCPVCGSMPHAGYLRDKEGRRFLQCSLCGHERRFSRTVCPFCAEARPEQLKIFFLEGDTQARAEGCETCKRYLPVPDLRASMGEIPLEMLALCLMPLDMLMQEKGYTPAAHA